MRTRSASSRADATERHPVRDRLWLGGFGMILFLATLAAGTYLANPARWFLRGTPGMDLLPSYMAGSFVREGRLDKLMDWPAAVKFQAHVRRVEGLEQHGRTGPWLNPPFYAWLFVPLAGMTFRSALWAWFGMNLAFLAIALTVLCRMVGRPEGRGQRAECRGQRSEVRGQASEVRGQRVEVGGQASEGRGQRVEVGGQEADFRLRLDVGDNPMRGRLDHWRFWGLAPLLIAGSFPLIQTLASLQNTFLSLAILSGTVALWRARRGLAAGMLCGLLLFKPQLAVIVVGVMTFALGRRALLGFLVTASLLLLITLVTMPGALGGYFLKLPALLPWLASGQRYAWERQVTFQGFWRLWIQGPVAGPAPRAVLWLWPPFAIAVGVALAAPVLRISRRLEQPWAQDRLIAAAIAAMPLLMPYYMDYDLLLLAVPAVLFAREWASKQRHTRLDRLVLGTWIVLFPWLYLNAIVSDLTRISFTVPLLACLALMLIGRAWRCDADGAEQASDHDAPLALAA